MPLRVVESAMPVMPCRIAAVAALAATLAGCGPRPVPHAAAAIGTPPAGVRYGRIVATRTVALASDARVRESLLAAIGAPAEPAGGRTAAEFIVVEEGGQTLSVIQTNLEHLAPGERVAIMPGARTRLVRAPSLASG
jgi:hypothetical protein